MTRCFQIHAADNVATALDDLVPGPVELLGVTSGTQVQAIEAIQLGHKLALRAIPEGEPVTKFGVPIGIASSRIEPGSWVHLHNCHSQVDERSSHLDVHTGAAKDTHYA